MCALGVCKCAGRPLEMHSLVSAALHAPIYIRGNIDSTRPSHLGRSSEIVCTLVTAVTVLV